VRSVAAALIGVWRWPLVLAFLLTVGVELTQRQIPAINRSCDIVDVLDNTVGVLIGAAAGLLVVAAVAPVRPLAPHSDK
jgi:glycopeptide antibiotics resistance protein